MGRVNTQLFETDTWEGTPLTSSGIAYATGDLIGATSIPFTDTQARKCTSGSVRKVTICDKDAQAKDLEMWFLSQSPSASTFTNNSAFTLATADLQKVLGVIRVSEHYAAAANGISQGDGNVPFQLESQQTALHALLVARGAPTYQSTAALLVRLGVAKD